MSDNNLPLILYIEDNPDNRKLVQKVLTAAGFNVHVVADGLAGLDFVDDHRPDLVLIDISMPHMDGYQVTQMLREKSNMTHIPIIAVTAHAMKGDEEKSLDAGCNGYIRKPIDIDRFPAEVTAYLDRAHTPAPANQSIDRGVS